MVDTLTTKKKWEDVWADVKLPVITKPSLDSQKQLRKLLLQDTKFSFFEIGCAPGGWMAYFSKYFGYQVSGIEYAEHAAEATQKNMKLLGLDAQIFTQDFFLYDCVQNKYDVVFSSGFIEHFQEVKPVVEKICDLSKRYVITIVPNVYGVNGFISKTVRPKVYAEHNPVSLELLEKLHRRCGVKTLFCNYVGGVRFIMPGAHNDYFNEHKYIAKVINIPFRVFNFVSSQISHFVGYVPRSKIFSESLMYIGVKDMV